MMRVYLDKERGLLFVFKSEVVEDLQRDTFSSSHAYLFLQSIRGTNGCHVECMEKINHLMLGLLLLLCVPALCHLKHPPCLPYFPTIYIRPGGDDLRGDGTALRPYQTLSKAMEVATSRSIIIYQISREGKEMYFRPVKESVLPKGDEK